MARDRRGRLSGRMLRSDLVEAAERTLPEDFLAHAPFRRVALYLQVERPASDAARRGELRMSLQDGWLDVSVPLDGRVLRLAPPAERRRILEETIFGALARIAERFDLPAPPQGPRRPPRRARRAPGAD